MKNRPFELVLVLLGIAFVLGICIGLIVRVAMFIINL